MIALDACSEWIQLVYWTEGRFVECTGVQFENFIQYNLIVEAKNLLPLREYSYKEDLTIPI